MNLGKWTYLVWLLSCALPIVLIQWLAAPARQRDALRATLFATGIVGTYLSVVDQLAIADGIWRFSEARILGIYVGRVPLEEIFFFFLTSLLVAQSLALFLPRASSESEPRSDLS